MKLLLTSLGLSNDIIVGALEDLLGKPLRRSRMVYVPTAIHAVEGGAGWAWETMQLVRPDAWGHVSILELTAVAGLPRQMWLPPLRSADAIVVGGGNTPFLSYWFERSGFADALPELLADAVYVGVSAGSMIVGSGFTVNRARLETEGVYDDDLYGDRAPRGFGSDHTVGLVDFAIRPHLGSADYPELTLDRVAARATGPTWVLDDRSAVVVQDGDVRVASAGDAHYLP